MSHRRLLRHRGLAGREREADLENSVEAEKEEQRPFTDLVLFLRSRQVSEHGNFGADSTNKSGHKDELGSGKSFISLKLKTTFLTFVNNRSLNFL